MSRYDEAKEMYAALGVDTEAALETVKGITVSVNCWQGDDLQGFDSPQSLSGGIQATGNYPGAARTPKQLADDMDFAFSLMPGKKKLNLHSSYAVYEEGETPDRSNIQPRHFKYLVDYAKERGLGIDFNPTFFLIPWSRIILRCPLPMRLSAAIGLSTANAVSDCAAILPKRQAFPVL